MPSRYALAGLAPMSVLVAFAACSTAPPGPRALLNENTGVTISVVAAPMLFARLRNAATASGHDYVTLVAMENDAAGKYTELFLLYRWSMSGSPPPKESAGRLLI